MYKVSTLKKQPGIITSLNLGLKPIVVSVDSLQDLQDLESLVSSDITIVCLSGIFNRDDVAASIPLLLQFRYCLALKNIRYVLQARQLLEICRLPNFLGCFCAQTANRVGKTFASAPISSLSELENKKTKGSYLTWSDKTRSWQWTYSASLCRECVPPPLDLKG